MGIALGVATLIVTMAVMNGVRTELLNKILGLNGHITVTSQAGGIADYNNLTDRLKGLSNAAHSVPLVTGQALATSGSGSGGVQVIGISAGDLASKQIHQQALQAGTIDEFPQGIMLGSKLAANLRVTVGDEVTLISPRGLSSAMGMIPRSKAYRVTGIFEVGMYDYDSLTILMPFEEAQKYFQYRGTASGIELRLDNPMQSDAVVDILRRSLTSDYRIYDWRQANANFVEAINVQRNVLFFILSLIILVAAFNVISSMIMLVKDKARSIAILRAMGVSRNSVMRIFFMAGASIGVIGTLSGCIIGVAFALNIEKIRKFLESLLDVNLFSSEIYFLSQLPVKLEPEQVMLVVCLALGLSLLATLYPAWKAARIAPAEALRYS